MRGIPGSEVVLFFAAVYVIELLAYLGIRQLINLPKTRKKVSYLYWGLSLILFGILIYAFANPSRLRETQNYQFFYFVISVSFLNLLPKILLALSYLISVPVRLVKARYSANLILMVGVILSLGCLLMIGYGITFGRQSLRIIEQEVQLSDLPKSLDKTIIVHISDFHLASFQDPSFLERCTKKINETNPDLILFTGDMVNNYYQEMIGFEKALGKMEAKYGKYAILGNHDYGDYSNWKSKEDKQLNQQILLEKIETSGFKLLLNQSVKVSIESTDVDIIGVENWGHRTFPQYADLDQALQGTREQSFKLLMTHDPAHWAEQVIGKTDIPLTFAGHTHGAQSGILFAGIEFSPMYFVQKYWGGLYREQEQYLYVNRGLGCVGLLGRIEMDPEITVLTLRSK